MTSHVKGNDAPRNRDKKPAAAPVKQSKPALVKDEASLE